MSVEEVSSKGEFMESRNESLRLLGDYENIKEAFSHSGDKGAGFFKFKQQMITG
jgi:hypothetical protein